MARTRIPPNFPRPTQLGSVAGAQPKLLARQVAGRFVDGPTPSEVVARFEMCENLVEQLIDYCARKLSQHPDWTRRQLLAKVGAAVRAKAFGWGLSQAEAEWVVDRIDKLTEGDTPPAEPTS